MITLLSNYGYRYTDKLTLDNREFRKGDQFFTQSETLSTFDYPVFDIEEEFVLFLTERSYRESILREILDLTRSEGRDDQYMIDMNGYVEDGYIKEQTGYDNVEVTVIKDEQGYTITFLTMMQGVT